VGRESITVHRVPRGRVVEWLREKEREGVLIDIKLGVYLLFAPRA